MTAEELLAGINSETNQASDTNGFGPIGKQLSVDDLLQGIQTQSAGSEPKTSTGGAVLRAAAENVGPGAAAAAAFAPAAELGSVAGPVGSLITGVAGSAIAAGGAAWAQHKAAQLIAPDATAKLDKLDQADEEQHPVAGAIGRIASSLPMFELAPLQSVKGVSALFKAARGIALTDVEKDAAKATAAQVGLGTGQAVVAPLLFGDSPTKQGIAEAFVQSLILGHPRYELFGKEAVKPIAAEEQAKDEAAKEQSEDVNSDLASTYKPPLPAPVLSPDDRANLSLLAAKSATGAPMTVEDTALHARLLTGDNEAARQFFNQEQHTWANEKVSALAGEALKKADLNSTSNANEPTTTKAVVSAEETRPETPSTAPAAETPAVTDNPAIRDSGQPPVLSQPEVETKGAPVRADGTNGMKPAPNAAPEPSLPPKPEWTKFQGDPNQLVEQFRDVAQSNEVNVARAGQRAEMYTDLNAVPADQAKALVYQDKTANANAGAVSRKLVALQSPDGSHVIVGTASEVVKNGKRTAKVSTYDVGAGRKSPGGQHYSSDYDKMIADGWKPLASLKTDKPIKGYFATYSSDQWHGVEAALHDIKGAAQRTTEAVAATLETSGVKKNGKHIAAPDSERGDEHPTGDEAAEAVKTVGDANGGEVPIQEGTTETVSQTGQRAFQFEHAQAIADAVKGMGWEEIKDTDKLVEALKESGHRSVEAFKVLVRHILDSGTGGFTDAEALQYAKKLIYENQSGDAATSAERIEKSARVGESEEGTQGSGIHKGRPDATVATPADAGSSTAPAGNQQGAGRAEAGAGENPENGGQPATAATADAKSVAAANAARVEAPKIVAADKDGLGPKDYNKLQAVAEHVAELQGHTERDDKEEMADLLLEHGQAVKVDGVPGLLVGDTIHVFGGKSYPAPQDLLAGVAKLRTQQAKEDIERLRPTGAKTAQIAASVERNLEAMGIKVNRVVDVLAKHFSTGEYKELTNGKGNTVRIINWAMADAHSPTSDNLVSLLHEVFHAVFARETPEMRAAAHRAVESVSNEALGIGSFAEAVAKNTTAEQAAGIQQEGRIAESLARKLVNDGFDPQTADGFVQRAFRLLKDMYNGTLMALAKVARYPVSQERAMAYFENRLKMVAAGDTVSWLNFLGGPRMKSPDWGRTDMVKYAGINPTTNPQKYLETREGAPVGIAALNHFQEGVLATIKEWNLTKNFDGLPDDEIFKHFIQLPEYVGESDMFTGGSTPASLIDAASKLHNVPPGIKIDKLPNEIAKQRAMAVSHRMMAEWQTGQAGKSMAARADWNRQAHELKQNNDRLVRLAKNYVNLDVMFSEAKESMLDSVKQLKTAVRGIREVATQKGELEQVLNDLGSDAGAKPFAAALDKVTKLLTENEGGRISEALRQVAELDIDWKLPAQRILEGLGELHATGGHDYLKPFLGTDDDSQALAATMITYGKANTHMMDLMAARATRTEGELAQVNLTLKALLNMTGNELTGIKQNINKVFTNLKARDRMVRVADRIAGIKRENDRLLDAVGMNKAQVDFYEDVFKPITDERMADLEKRVGIQLTHFEVYHGAEVPVPLKPDAKPSEFVGNRLKLRTDVGKRGERPTATPEVIGWLARMDGWLANKANQKYGAKYNEVADAALKLKNHFVTDEHRNLQGSAATRILGPLQEKCNQAGTTAARLSGQAFNRYSSLLRAKMREVVQRGTDFSTRLNDARAACGYPAASESTFWDNVIAPALHHLEQNGEQFWANAASENEMVKDGIAHAIQFMNLKSDKARAAVEKLLMAHTFNSDLMVKNGAEVGNKVMDQSGKYTIFRKVLGKAPFTLPRALTAIAQDAYREHMAEAWGGDAMKAAKVAAAYQTDPNALRETLKSRFTPEVWNWFMKSLAYNDRASFYAPSDNNLKPLADRQAIISAYDKAQDPVTFAENLARLHGQAPTPEFVGDTLDTIQNFHNLLRTMVGDEAETVKQGSPAPARFIVDARHIEAAPKEWLEYLQSDQYNLEKIIHGQAFQAAFGRNGSAMDRNLSTAIADQRRMADKYQAMRDAIQKENPGVTEKQLQQIIKEKAAVEGIEHNQLKQAQANLTTLNGVRQSFEAIKGMNNAGKIPELLPWARLMRTIGGWTVSGAGTAITAHSVFLEQPTRLFGLNGRSLAMTARSVGDLAKVLANSMLQSVGRECAFEADRMLAANEAGLFDPINTNRQRFITAYNHSYAAYQQSGALGRKVGTVADVAGAALQADVFAPGAREKALERQAADKAVAPTLKLFSPFHWIAESLQISNFITWQRHIEGLVASGARYFKQHPELVDDPNFKVTREMLGDFGAGDREFRFLQQRMNDFGFSLEQLVRDAHQNSGTDKPILSDEVNKAVQQLTLNEITLESSLTSRMPGLQTSGLGVAMNPFLGWPLQKTYQVLRQLREPNGEATVKALRTGLTAYMAILPIGMAVAWLRNKFDEDVLGRKQNISDLGNIHDAKSGLLTALDNASRVGTFGFIGEGANYFLNDDNVRPLSVDNRVFFLNTIENLYNAARGLHHEAGPQLSNGNFSGAASAATDYQTTLRPLFSDFGGSGLLQNLGALNHILGADDAEARVSNRISVNNYLRVAGRELNLDVRTFGGMLQNQSSPTPLKPLIGQMVLAAYANDHEAFHQALKSAVAEAKAEGLKPEEAMKKVATMYEGQNPIKIVFKSPPTEQEYHKLIAQLPDNGKQSVIQSLSLYQHYGSQIGASTSLFAKEKSQPRETLRDDVMSGVFNQLRGARVTAGAF